MDHAVRVQVVINGFISRIMARGPATGTCCPDSPTIGGLCHLEPRGNNLGQIVGWVVGEEAPWTLPGP